MEARTINIYERLNTPLDCGCGTDIEEIARSMALTKAKEEALERSGIDPGAAVRFLTTVPYAGSEPLVEVASMELDTDYPDFPA